MTKTDVSAPIDEGTEEKAFQAAKVAKALQLLQVDPRTSELAEMVPSLIAMAAMQQGVTGEAAQLKEGELSDVFQAVYDAWGEAEVHVSDLRFEALRQEQGGDAPIRRPSQ
jgi:hypothetical protein